MKNCPNSNLIYKENSGDFRSIRFVFDEFIDSKIGEGKSDKTLKTYKDHFNFFLKSLGHEDCDIREITTTDYNNFVKIMKGRKVSPATIQSYANSLRSFFNWAYERGEIFYNVNIPMVKAQTKIKGGYTDEELSKLLKKPDVTKCTFTEYKIWVLENLAICTGLRISSMLDITMNDVSLDDCSIIINTTKNKEAFVTYFNLDMKKILQEYLKYRCPGCGTDYLFCRDDGKPLARRTAQQELAEYNRKRGVYKTSAHLFRHTFAKNATRAGMNIYVLMNMLQHRDISTTYRYLRKLGLDIEERKDIYNPQQKFVSNNFKRRMR